MHRGLVLVRKNSGALHDDVDAELFPRQLGGVSFSQHLDGRAQTDIHQIAVDRHLAGEPSVHAVIFEQVSIILGGHQIVDGDEVNVAALGLGGRAQHVSADAAESRDRNFHCHRFLPAGGSCRNTWRWNLSPKRGICASALPEAKSVAINLTPPSPVNEAYLASGFRAKTLHFCDFLWGTWRARFRLLTRASRCQ